MLHLPAFPYKAIRHYQFNKTIDLIVRLSGVFKLNSSATSVSVFRRKLLRFYLRITNKLELQ